MSHQANFIYPEDCTCRYRDNVFADLAGIKCLTLVADGGGHRIEFSGGFKDYRIPNDGNGDSLLWMVVKDGGGGCATYCDAFKFICGLVLRKYQRA
ncbi:hypothetical protein LCGC14_3133430 [marine sediment metagenome]|uniref:Uncharacterized protein n=1 Tax=marine sediment metagenome TaxID=412755 RepID=A0A0F8Y606_9ZZZZ